MRNSDQTTLKRRQFLSHSCSLGVATATLGSSLLQLGLARQASAQSSGDYKALVCILLAGGNDSYNMLVPNDAQHYAGYAAIRSDLALPQESLLALPNTDNNGRSFALHPGMSGLRSLFASGQAATLAGVGTLLAPMDSSSLATGNANLPLGLFSHSDQIQQWQTAVSDERIAQGWGGRIADLLEQGSPANGISMNVSLAGNNVFQSGSVTKPYAISASGDGAPALAGYNETGGEGEFTRAAIDGLLAAAQSKLFRREYGKRLISAIESQVTFVNALSTAEELPTSFSDGPFSAALRQIARVIAAREALGASRQTFFITVGGWDHHDDVLDNQATMLPSIDTGLLEFQTAMNGMGIADQVTTFTTSDFGRTLTSNGKGSDHGWGGHHIVLGGAVNGGRFYGEYPDIYSGNPLDVGRGIYAPTTSVDEYFAELALWFGVSDGDLSTVLPNVDRFFSAGGGAKPLGFLS
ncbi:MAG: hypothetical protein ACI8RN_001869 [Glaciecola sp.]|jgi:uncharacterized protein (DUF1501 family)|uniref:DUF1501 domain-containing protein n=1 Tax=Congregibacter sp. TaxID=2744308 RepID=UPI0039E515D4